MGLITRCLLTSTPCAKPITIEQKTFFLAEAEEPEEDRKRRTKAINEAIVDGFKIRSALEEKGINAFTCKICEMIQTCAYGMADISQNNANVYMELGMMLALGKPTIILAKKGQEKRLNLPSDVTAIEIISFKEYLDIIDPLREISYKLPPAMTPSSAIEDLEKIEPQFAQEIKKIGAEIVEEFKDSIKAAKLDTTVSSDTKAEIPPELSEKLRSLEEKLEDIRGLGFITDANTAFLRGNYFSNQGRYEEALACYNWYLELKPDDPAALYNRGNTYIELGKYDEALKDLNHSIELKPDDPRTFNNRGGTYARIGRYDEALADYNRSLELQPDNPDTLGNRGITYGNLGKYDEALADYNRSLELQPDHPDTLGNRGVTYGNLGKYDEALADYNRSLELQPDDPHTFYNSACLYSLKGKIDDALSYLEKAIDKDKKYREMAKTDKDFDNIREDPRFKKLIKSD